MVRKDQTIQLEGTPGELGSRMEKLRQDDTRSETRAYSAFFVCLLGVLFLVLSWSLDGTHQVLLYGGAILLTVGIVANRYFALFNLDDATQEVATGLISLLQGDFPVEGSVKMKLDPNSPTARAYLQGSEKKKDKGIFSSETTTIKTSKYEHPSLWASMTFKNGISMFLRLAQQTTIRETTKRTSEGSKYDSATSTSGLVKLEFKLPERNENSDFQSVLKAAPSKDFDILKVSSVDGGIQAILRSHFEPNRETFQPVLRWLFDALERD